MTAISPRLARALTALPQACSIDAVAGSAGSIRSSILPPSSLADLMALAL